jgi:hypothetical protein
MTSRSSLRYGQVGQALKKVRANMNSEQICETDTTSRAPTAHTMARGPRPRTLVCAAVRSSARGFANLGPGAVRKQKGGRLPKTWAAVSRVYKSSAGTQSMAPAAQGNPVETPTGLRDVQNRRHRQLKRAAGAAVSEVRRTYGIWPRRRSGLGAVLRPRSINA